MKMLVRTAAALSLCAALVGVSSLATAGKKSAPLPDPDPLCLCACPSGPPVIAHAPSGTSCEDACPAIAAAFCASDM